MRDEVIKSLSEIGITVEPSVKNDEVNNLPVQENDLDDGVNNLPEQEIDQDDDVKNLPAPEIDQDDDANNLPAQEIDQDSSVEFYENEDQCDGGELVMPLVENDELSQIVRKLHKFCMYQQAQLAEGLTEKGAFSRHLQQLINKSAKIITERNKQRINHT